MSPLIKGRGLSRVYLNFTVLQPNRHKYPSYHQSRNVSALENDLHAVWTHGLKVHCRRWMFKLQRRDCLLLRAWVTRHIPHFDLTNTSKQNTRQSPLYEPFYLGRPLQTLLVRASSCSPKWFWHVPWQPQLGHIHLRSSKLLVTHEFIETDCFPRLVQKDARYGPSPQPKSSDHRDWRLYGL